MLVRSPFVVDVNERMVRVGLALHALTGPRARVAVTWAGALPYFADRESIDLLGKTDVVIAHEPMRLSAQAYLDKLTSAIEVSHLPVDYQALFLEVVVDDSSDFETALEVRGVVRHGYQILEVHGPVVPNTIASVLLHIRDVTGLMPHIYFRWTEGNPFTNLLRFLAFGEGEIAPVTREVLREAEPDVTKRPWVHVG